MAAALALSQPGAWATSATLTGGPLINNPHSRWEHKPLPKAVHAHEPAVRSTPRPRHRVIAGDAFDDRRAHVTHVVHRRRCRKPPDGGTDWGDEVGRGWSVPGSNRRPHSRSKERERDDPIGSDARATFWPTHLTPYFNCNSFDTSRMEVMPCRVLKEVEPPAGEARLVSLQRMQHSRT